MTPLYFGDWISESEIWDPGGGRTYFPDPLWDVWVDFKPHEPLKTHLNKLINPKCSYAVRSTVGSRVVDNSYCQIPTSPGSPDRAEILVFVTAFASAAFVWGIVLAQGCLGLPENISVSPDKFFVEKTWEIDQIPW